MTRYAKNQLVKTLWIGPHRSLQGVIICRWGGGERHWEQRQIGYGGRPVVGILREVEQGVGRDGVIAPCLAKERQDEPVSH